MHWTCTPPVPELAHAAVFCLSATWPSLESLHGYGPRAGSTRLLVTAFRHSYGISRMQMLSRRAAGWHAGHACSRTHVCIRQHLLSLTAEPLLCWGSTRSLQDGRAAKPCCTSYLCHPCDTRAHALQAVLGPRDLGAKACGASNSHALRPGHAELWLRASAPHRPLQGRQCQASRLMDACFCLTSCPRSAPAVRGWNGSQQLGMVT